MTHRYGFLSTCLLAFVTLGALGCAAEGDAPEVTTAQESLQSAAPPQVDGPFLIHTFATNSCVAVSAGSREFNAPLIQWTCNGGAEQDWYFIHRGGDQVMIKNKNSGLCIGVSGDSWDPGAQLVQWPCAYANQNEQWIWHHPIAGDHVTSVLENRYAGWGLMMAVSAGDPHPGTRIIQWDANQGPEQTFYVFSPNH